MRHQSFGGRNAMRRSLRSGCAGSRVIVPVQGAWTRASYLSARDTEHQYLNIIEADHGGLKQ
jgi:hypothetical protein